MLQPVNRLPPEILCRVVRFVPDKKAKDAKSIVPLTHVCRYWRESIVSAPGNWTLISSGSKDLTALSLGRSKAAPLEIDLNLRTRDREFLNLLLPRIHNTESLTVHGFSSIEELIRALPNFPRSTPNLQSLSLHIAYTRAERERSIDPFESLVDTLKHLSLNHFPLYPFLRLRSLTELDLIDNRFNHHVDTLLNFLKENPSLETVTLGIGFAEASLRSTRLSAAIETQLRHLSIRGNAMDSKAIISGIAFQRGTRLEINHQSSDAFGTLSGILSGIPAKQLSNLLSPTFMECQSYCRSIRLLGPSGDLLFKCLHGPEDPFSELHLLPLTLTNVRELRIVHCRSGMAPSPLKPTVFHPSSLSALETLAVNCETSVSHLFSTLFSNPSSSPSLKTLAFLDCNLTEDFMEELMKFALNRKGTTSARLHRVVIVNSKGKLPTITSVDALGKHVPVVDARMGKEFPKDLT